MELPSLQELTHLPEEEALRQRVRAENYRALRQLAVATAILGFLLLLYRLLEGRYVELLPAIAALVVARWIFASGEKEWFQRHFAVILPVTLLALLGLLIAISPDLDVGLRVVGLVGAMMLVAFRLSTPVVLALGLLIWAGTLVWPFLQSETVEGFLTSPRFLIQTLATVGAIYFSVAGTNRNRVDFFRRFRIESSRNRERLRMREELDSARQIQLSMLPRRDPGLPGLDIASVSLPATEVGGDYFEYFPDEKRGLSLIIADVAGHGVASGLLLSGIRSCLYLLHPDRPAPLDAVERLNRMVRSTTDRRMFITFLYADIDVESRTVRLVSAGHPPMLHVTPAGQVTELGAPAPPLGTNLDSRYSEVSLPLESGDFLLFYTDGVTETVNRQGDLYGEERLMKRLRHVASKTSAREVRESLLSDVWTFKGDVEQHDDITMVVLRVA